MTKKYAIATHYPDPTSNALRLGSHDLKIFEIFPKRYGSLEEAEGFLREQFTDQSKYEFIIIPIYSC